MSVSTKNICYCVHESLQFYCNLSHFNPFPNFTLYFLKIACVYLPIYAFSWLYQIQGPLGCEAVYFGKCVLNFRRNILLPFSG
jgi:hypothetical protein